MNGAPKAFGEGRGQRAGRHHPMRQRTAAWGLAAALVLSQLTLSTASAEPRRGVRSAPNARTSIRSVPRATPRSSSSMNSLRGSRSSGSATRRIAGSSSSARRGSTPGRSLGSNLGSALGSRGRTASGSTGRPLLDALSGALSDRAGSRGSGYDGAYGGSDALNELSYLFEDALRSRDHRSREDNEYKYQRDAMITNAVVQVVGMITDAQRQRMAYGPPVAAQPRHEVRRVLVQEGYYEKYQVYIPPVYDRHTGAQVGGGYHETRTRWVPPTYEERLVQVGP